MLERVHAHWRVSQLPSVEKSGHAADEHMVCLLPMTLGLPVSYGFFLGFLLSCSHWNIYTYLGTSSMCARSNLSCVDPRGKTEGLLTQMCDVKQGPKTFICFTCLTMVNIKMAENVPENIPSPLNPRHSLRSHHSRQHLQRNVVTQMASPRAKEISLRIIICFQLKSCIE